MSPVDPKRTRDELEPVILALLKEWDAQPWEPDADEWDWRLSEFLADRLASEHGNAEAAQ